MTTSAETLSHKLEEIWKTEQTLKGELSTVDHKKIGKRYIATAFFFLFLGGIEAIVMRTQLAAPGLKVLPAEAYNQVFTMHGVTMIYWYASPILSGFAVYLIPLMIGARDMAFPRLNAFTYWTFLLSGLILYAGFILGAAPNGGWFNYPPFTGPRYSPGLGIDFYIYALILFTISTTGGAINFIVTIFRMRAPGMAISRMPIFCWSTLTTSVVSVFALPALTVSLVFLELDRQYVTRFYEAARGGNPLLWQHLFWFFAHPWVYIIFLPATGMISMVLPVFSRRPIVGYLFVSLATAMTGILGFGVWVHHMFATGLPQLSIGYFSAISMTIAIPSAVQMFAWIATLWTGRPVLSTAMLFALGFLINFTIGGLNGVMTGVVPFDWQVHDTYFVVAHLHYVLIGANLFPVLAATYYWVPKMTGRLFSERLGKWSFLLTFVGFNLAFFPMHMTGLLGMPRRVYTYPAGLNWEGLNFTSTVGAYILALGLLLVLVNFFWTFLGGELAGSDPWNADTLEWLPTSPPPSYNFAVIPEVRTRHPLWDDFNETEGAGEERILAEGKKTLTTTVLDARPAAVADMPEDSLLPLITALLFTILMVALILKALWVALGVVIAAALGFGIWLWPREGAYEA